MREILFRGKRKDNHLWVEGFYYQAKFYRSDKELCHYITKPFPKTDGKPSDHIMVDTDTVGQYTGLTDKNGKKIFEGDIVHDGDSFLYGPVVYATPQDGFDGIAGFMVDDIDDGLQNYNGFWHLVEIVGNIHDNPELLGGEGDGN